MEGVLSYIEHCRDYDDLRTDRCSLPSRSNKFRLVGSVEYMYSTQGGESGILPKGSLKSLSGF